MGIDFIISSRVFFVLLRALLTFFSPNYQHHRIKLFLVLYGTDLSQIKQFLLQITWKYAFD